MMLSDFLNEFHSGDYLLRDGSFLYFSKVKYCDTPKSLVYITEEKSLIDIHNSVTCVIIPHDFNEHFKMKSIGVVLSYNPKKTFFELYIKQYNEKVEKERSKISPSAIISKTAVLDDYNVTIGDNTVIEDYVVIKTNTTIGSGCKIGSGSIIGADGFEAFFHNDKQTIVPHSGSVTIEDNVVIHSNVCIDKGLFMHNKTRICKEVLIDNQVHVAHNVTIGYRSIIAANSSIGGNTKVGESVWIGPNCTLANGLFIGEKAYIHLGSVVMRNMKKGQKVSGNFAIDHDKHLQRIIKDRKVGK